MTSESDFYLDVLREIVSQPTAPFHEERVAARVTAYLEQWHVPFSIDDTGNIIAHYQRGPACRPLVLMAHMDHPGITILTTDGPEGARCTARLEGGVAERYFQEPVAVRIYPAAPGTAAGVTAHSVGYSRDAESDAIDLQLQVDDPAAASLLQPDDFGVWDVPDFALRDGFIHARAIDDLAGCTAMLLTLWKAAQEDWDTDLYAVFTRAEEVGLIGAHAILQSGILPRDGSIVSLEASPARPGAEQGAGPVIRTGDRVTTFSQDAELALKAAAYSIGSAVWQPARGLLPADRTKVQRQLMSGGSCEGSAAIMHGYQTTGLAFPLANYHNMGENAKLAPEYIHAEDFQTGVLLLQEAARLLPELDHLRAEHLRAFAPSAQLLERLRMRR